MIAATHPTVDSFPEANGEQRRPWRATLALLSTVLLLGLVATTFWYQDWRYASGVRDDSTAIRTLIATADAGTEPTP